MKKFNNKKLRLRLEKSKKELDNLVELFIKSASPKYISHSELQQGRAISEKEWAPGLIRLIKKELNFILTKKTKSKKIISARNKENKVIGFILIDIIKENTNFCVLEDMVVDSSYRKEGVGTALITFLEDFLQELNISEIYLESGINNEEAHVFFEAKGFKKCSTIFRKKITKKSQF